MMTRHVSQLPRNFRKYLQATSRGEDGSVRKDRDGGAMKCVAECVASVAHPPGRSRHREVSQRCEVHDGASALFTFALASGMRPQEYLALRWSDVDMAAGTATVQRAIIWRQSQGGGWHFGEPKTSSSRRTIPLPSSMVPALAEHKSRQGEERLRLGPNWQNHDLVFPTTVGTPYNLSSLTNKWFKPALVEAGLTTTFRLYDLRHTHATMLLAAGVPVKVVSERLGHSSIVLTLDTYMHVLPDMQQGAAVKIEQALFQVATR